MELIDQGSIDSVSIRYEPRESRSLRRGRRTLRRETPEEDIVTCEPPKAGVLMADVTVEDGTADEAEVIVQLK
jgi:hypothetical protein